MKRLMCILALAIPLVLGMFVGLADASASTRPVGYIAVKPIAIPSGTPSDTLLGWSFNGFIRNATYSSPTCTVNVTQVLGADANSTVHAEPISTPLNKTYADDDDYYIVDATNATVGGPFYIDFTLNVTLGNHYITNASWITDAWVTVYGNVSDYCDTAADIYIYNFTGGTWKWLGHYLNYTTPHSAGYRIGALSNFTARYIDTSNNNTLMFRIYCNDTDTDFTLTIDYFKVDITYSLPISVGSWTATDEEIQHGVSRVFNHTETFTLTSPSGVTDHNFTVYYVTPNYPLITNIGQAVAASVSGSPVTVAPSQIAFNVTNLVSNQTQVNMYLPLVYLCGAPSGVNVTSISFQGGINKLTFIVSGSGTKTFTVRISRSPFGIYVDQQILPASNYTWSNGLLNVTVSLSAHTIEIYEFNPHGAPAPPTAPEEEIAPPPSPEVTIQPAINVQAIMLLVIIVAVAIGYALIKRS